MLLFYNPSFGTDLPFLPEEEARHCLKVLRMGVGDELHITDGKGNMYLAQLATADVKKCRVNIAEHQPEYGKRTYDIHIAVAPTKNADRTEWMVEKCVELGVDEISFIHCERSERKFFKTDRLEKIAVAAMKQSLKAYLPVIHNIISFRQFVEARTEKQTQEQKFIAHLEEGKRDLLQNIALKNNKYCILIGPEGDFSPGEISLALNRGYQPVSLGDGRLRTETAGMAACHILNLVNSR